MMSCYLVIAGSYFTPHPKGAVDIYCLEAGGNARANGL